MHLSITEQLHKIWPIFFPAFSPYSVLEIEKNILYSVRDESRCLVPEVGPGLLTMGEAWY